MNYILSINTSSQPVCIGINDKIRKVETLSPHHQQRLLHEINLLLKDNNLSLADINTIRINQTGGTFTGIRVGVAVANALAKALNIPISSNNNQQSEIVFPIYEHSPNISQPRNKL